MIVHIRIRNNTYDEISAEQMLKFARFNCPYGWEVASAKKIIDCTCDYIITVRQIKAKITKRFSDITYYRR